MSLSVKGNVVDIPAQRIYPAEIKMENEKIISITELTGRGLLSTYILPGFIDAHVHIESSMLLPSEFARLAVVHGTVATVSDPHEIANVCGIEGIEFMINNGNTVPFKFYFGAPSCVPATIFETTGATINVEQIDELLQKDQIKYLSEMMNFPGVLNHDKDVMEKIRSAERVGKPVDGHAPGLRGEMAKRYIDAGISTDHECVAKQEALDKLKYGMKIIIREGSAAKNFEALIDLLNDYPDMMMFCSDDKHPDSLVAGHINQLCQRAAARGIDIFKILKAACLNAVLHYKLDVGLLRPDDAADFIVVKDLHNFEVLQTYINGKLVAENGQSKIESNKYGIINQFHCSKKAVEDFRYLLDKWGNEENIEQVHVIEALDGQLITNKLVEPIGIVSGTGGLLQSNAGEDILKIVVVNRYNNAPIAKSFIKNMGFKKGAIASSVSHDSHNIVAVGVDEESICKAVNLIIEKQGGISCVHGKEEMILPLPVAGLMSNEDGYKIASDYTAIDAMAKNLGSKLSAPFMTLSFMALLVIPHIKLSDMGLFDGDAFKLM
ncbi:MAG TPA: adenine deaminase [Puia sp.]|jgi:adenine deaminase|nr:adenine deaminase [Puia sp.]